MGRPTRVLDTETVLSLQPLSTRMPCMRQHRTGCLSHPAACDDEASAISVSSFPSGGVISNPVRVITSPIDSREEGRWALPYGEYGLDVITLIGMLRYRQHHSLAELHQALRDRGMVIGERTGPESPGPL